MLAAPNEAQEIVSDYRSTGLTLNRHPVALLRERLNERRSFRRRTSPRIRTVGLPRHAGLSPCVSGRARRTVCLL